MQTLKSVHGPVAISKQVGNDAFVAGFGAGWPDAEPNTAGVISVSSDLTFFQEHPFQDGLKHRIHYIDDFYDPSSGERFLIAVGYGLGYLYRIDPFSVSFSHTVFSFPNGTHPRHFVQLGNSNHIAVITERPQALLYILKYNGNEFSQSSMVDLNEQFGSDFTGSEVKFYNDKVYISLRKNGANGLIVQFTLDDSLSRILELRSFEVQKTPRYFDIIDGKIFVGNQDSQTVQILAIQDNHMQLVSTTSFAPFQPCFIMKS